MAKIYGNNSSPKYKIEQDSPLPGFEAQQAAIDHALQAQPVESLPPVDTRRLEAQKSATAETARRIIARQPAEAEIATFDDIDREVTNREVLREATRTVLAGAYRKLSDHMPPAQPRSSLSYYMKGDISEHVDAEHHGIIAGVDGQPARNVEQSVNVIYTRKKTAQVMQMAMANTVEEPDRGFEPITKLWMGISDGQINQLSIVARLNSEGTYPNVGGRQPSTVYNDLTPVAQLLVGQQAKISFGKLDGGLQPGENPPVVSFSLREGRVQYTFSPDANLFVGKPSRPLDEEDLTPLEIPAQDFTAALKEINEVYIPPAVDPVG